MKKMGLRGIGWMAFTCLFSFAAALTDDDPRPETMETTAPQIVPSDVTPSGPFKFGVDYYVGSSNLTGFHKFSDGFWAGNLPALPSTSYVRWENDKGYAAMFSVGVGEMYTMPNSLLDQPVEAWWQFPIGKQLRVTIGKFWVPFAIQEWEYETKPGIMLQWTEGAYDLVASFNYNQNTRRTNTYLRAGYNFGENNRFGVSWGTGRGLSYDTDHDRAWGLDGAFGWNGWRVYGEYVQCLRGSKHFDFASGKLAYENFGRWQPFVAAYRWNDQAGAFGRFRSTVYGLGYQISPGLTLEGGYANTSTQGTWWAQLHWSFER